MTTRHVFTVMALTIRFLSDPLVEPDNNLCERKARILKGKINQAISLKSFEHLTYFCECLSVLDHFATNSEDNLYELVKEVYGLNVRQDKGLPRVPCYRTLFFPTP